MTFERTFRFNGDVINLNGGGLLLDAQVTVGGSDATVTLRTDDDRDGLAAVLIQSADLSRGRDLVVDTPTGSYTLIGKDGRRSSVVNGGGVSFSGGGVQINSFSGNVGSGMSVVGGDVYFGGQRYVPADNDGNERITRGIYAVINIPRDGELGIDGHNVDITATGRDALGGLYVDTHNGDTSVHCPVKKINVNGHNGAVTVTDLAGDASISLHNGNADLTARAPGTVAVSTHNGSIVVRDPDRLEDSGRLRVRMSTHNGRKSLVH